MAAALEVQVLLMWGQFLLMLLMLGGALLMQGREQEAVDDISGSRMAGGGRCGDVRSGATPVEVIVRGSSGAPLLLLGSAKESGRWR